MIRASSGDSSLTETTVRARFVYEVAQLQVAKAALGTESTVIRGGCSVIVSLPPRRTAAPRDWLEDFRNFWGHGSGLIALKEVPHAWVTQIATSVISTFALSPTEVESGGERALEEAREAFGLFHRIADEVTREYLDHMIVVGRQAWLGVPGEPLTAGRGEIREEGGGRYPLSSGQHGAGTAFVKPADRVVGRNDHQAAVALLVAPQVLGVGETLLAEAVHLARYTLTPHASRALLMAAIACEVQVKAKLRTLASDQRRPLLDLMLDNPRDWSLAAAAMFDKLAEAAVGRSLRHEDPNLFRAIDALFQARNAFAHRGVQPSRREAISAAEAAEKAFDWLETLDGSGTR